MENLREYNQQGSPLRNVQLKMLDILISVDKICRENKICYWIDFGTLLGAVRHQGFIPWDDDLDIYVIDKDFERFQKLCMEQLPDTMFLQNETTDPNSKMGDGLIKIRDKKSLFVHEFENFKSRYNRGVFIDVFKAQAYPVVPKRVFKFLFSRIKFAYGFSHYNPDLNLKNIIGYFVYPLSLRWHKFILWCFTRRKEVSMYGATPERYTYGYYSSLEDIFPLREIEFEGHLFMAPHNPDACLRNVYGDYMQIPPAEKRRTHVVYAFMDRKEGAINVD